MRRAGAEREISSFDEGELWYSDDTTPPASPAGWYFRPKRGGTPAWIGPFASAEEAAHAPFSGDALRDAQRRLTAWQRAKASGARARQRVAGEPGEHRSPVEPDGRNEARAAAAADTPVAAGPGDATPQNAAGSHAPITSGSDSVLPAATAQPSGAAAAQLALDLGEQGALAASPLPRRGSRRRDASGSGEQGDLPF